MQSLQQQVKTRSLSLEDALQSIINEEGILNLDLVDAEGTA